VEIAVLIAACLVILFLPYKLPFIATGIFTILIALLIATDFVTFRIWHLAFDGQFPVFVSVVTFGVMLAGSLVAGERTRRQIEAAFNRYLSPSIVSRLAEDPSALRLGGELREITVMFADLSGFTSSSANLKPEVLTAKVNKYLGLVVEQVEATGG